jgi:hypothetical protein
MSSTKFSGKDFEDAMNFLAAVSKGHQYAFMSDVNEEELDPNDTTVDFEGDLAKKKALGVPPTAYMSEDDQSKNVPSEEVPVTRRRATKKKAANSEDYFDAVDEIRPPLKRNIAQGKNKIPRPGKPPGKKKKKGDAIAPPSSAPPVRHVSFAQVQN